jgi:hypothetical protein
MPAQRRFMIIVFVIGLLLYPMTMPLVAQSEVIPGIVVLQMEGTIRYSRAGWKTQLALTPGTVIHTNDLVFPQNASLLVLCPNAQKYQFLPSELLPNDTLRCPSSDVVIQGETGLKRARIQRGGQQNPAVPYLIAPRGTVLRQPRTTLIWNNPTGVEHYEVTVFQGLKTVWKSDQLPAPQSETASVNLPVELKPDLPYSVEICAVFTNLNRGCTTDPGWATTGNVAFYYHADAELEAKLNKIIAALGEATPEALYAQAILLSQPIASLSTADLSLAYTQEAIALLEQLLTEHGNSSLAQPAQIHVQLGTLYRAISLSSDAARHFQTALERTQSGTESAALAATGLASTTPKTSEAVPLYDAALDHYAAFMDEATFINQFSQLCSQIGDVCLDLEHCSLGEADCRKWFRNRPA